MATDPQPPPRLDPLWDSGLDDDDLYYEDWEESCQTCGGDGIETSDQLMEEDPLWWEGVDYIPCRNCGGSGDAKNQTYW